MGESGRGGERERLIIGSRRKAEVAEEAGITEEPEAGRQKWLEGEPEVKI